MRLVIQRASRASLVINGGAAQTMGQGLVVLVGIEESDDEEDVHWLLRKLLGLRIFSDEEQKMNRSLQDSKGELMLVSQFTLHASTRKGNRPSFIRAARPEQATPLYELLVEAARAELAAGREAVLTGEFGADMQVELVNDGPVTIIIDSKNRE